MGIFRFEVNKQKAVGMCDSFLGEGEEGVRIFSKSKQ